MPKPFIAIFKFRKAISPVPTLTHTTDRKKTEWNFCRGCAGASQTTDSYILHPEADATRNSCAPKVRSKSAQTALRIAHRVRNILIEVIDLAVDDVSVDVSVDQ